MIWLTAVDEEWNFSSTGGFWPTALGIGEVLLDLAWILGLPLLLSCLLFGRVAIARKGEWNWRYSLGAGLLAALLMTSMRGTSDAYLFVAWIMLSLFIPYPFRSCSRTAPTSSSSAPATNGGAPPESSSTPAIPVSRCVPAV